MRAAPVTNRDSHVFVLAALPTQPFYYGNLRPRMPPTTAHNTFAHAFCKTNHCQQLGLSQRPGQQGSTLRSNWRLLRRTRTLRIETRPLVNVWSYQHAASSMQQTWRLEARRRMAIQQFASDVVLAQHPSTSREVGANSVHHETLQLKFIPK